MAVIYYPKNQLMYIRDTTVSASNFESIVLNVAPNTVLYFDTQSLIQTVNATQIPITASWALTASISTIFATTVSASWASASISASYSGTASYAINAGGGNSASWASSSVSASYSVNADTASMIASNYVSYGTLLTSSTNWITMSLADRYEFVSITTGLLYNFTCSNLPSSTQVSETALYISNSAATTSSLSFPPNWQFLGSKPTAITASKSAILNLIAYGQNVLATFAPQF